MESLCKCGKPGFIVHHGEPVCPDCALEELHQMMLFEAQVTTNVADFTAESGLERVRGEVKALYLQVAPYLPEGERTVNWARRTVYAVSARPKTLKIDMSQDEFERMCAMAPAGDAAILRKYLVPKMAAKGGSKAYVTIKEA